MLFANEINFKKIITLSQLDKIILTMIVTCLAPIILHALPFFTAVDVGQKWLPIFYAPLVAALLFSPHVSLLVGLLAPMINHFLFNAPNQAMANILTFELLVFASLILLLKRKINISGLIVALVYILTRVVTMLIFNLPGNLFDSVAISLPGIVMLAVITEVVKK